MQGHGSTHDEPARKWHHVPTDHACPTCEGRGTLIDEPCPAYGAPLAREGLPAFGDGKRGDQYLRVQVQIPEQLSAEGQTLYERLRTLGVAHEPERH